MTVRIEGGPGGSLNRDVTSIDDTDSPYTTGGEDILLVDTSGGAVTVVLATADATADPESSIRIYDSGENASSNNITVNTEGSENINPGTLSSVTLSVDGTWIDLQADGSNWFADLAPEVSSLTADTVTTNTSLTDANANTIADFAGQGLSVDGSNVLNSDTQKQVVSSNTTTSGSGVYLVDTSDGAKTLNLSTADAGGNASIGVVNVNGSNAVSVDTEGAETIDPGGASSKTLSTEGWVTWFNSDGSDWDSSLDADVESVTTEDLTNADVTKASTKVLYGGLAADNAGAELRVQPTDDVSTSATDIFDTPGGAVIRGGIVVVQGDEQSNNARFVDILSVGNTADTAQHSEEQNSPAGRTYSRNGNTIQLAMASGTWDVVAAGLTTVRDSNAT